jgi:hypothetical protein
MVASEAVLRTPEDPTDVELEAKARDGPILCCGRLGAPGSGSREGASQASSVGAFREGGLAALQRMSMHPACRCSVPRTQQRAHQEVELPPSAGVRLEAPGGKPVSSRASEADAAQQRGASEKLARRSEPDREQGRGAGPEPPGSEISGESHASTHSLGGCRAGHIGLQTAAGQARSAEVCRAWPASEDCSSWAWRAWRVGTRALRGTLAELRVQKWPGKWRL